MELKHWKHYFYSRGYDEATLQSAVHLRILTESLTYPLSLGYAIQRLLATESLPLPKDRPMYIHILNASPELLCITESYWNELSIIFPMVRFYINLIGVGIPSKYHNTQQRISSKICLGFWRGSYTSYCSYHTNSTTIVAHLNVVAGDLFATFSSGVGAKAYHTQDEWQEDLGAVLRSGIPAVYTAYSDKELRRDVSFLSEGMRAEFALEAHSNPFKSLAKKLNPFSPHSTYQENLYLFIVQGSIIIDKSEVGFGLPVVAAAAEAAKVIHQHQQENLEHAILGFLDALDVQVLDGAHHS
eukprot:TRINITY_DN7416_c0_g1_i2.p1 TRINITY_DN7416_c0_g1~~TRINITY_DN7416_c0_g1_i2.p1  ORF type:complete len:299 (+),score=35.54 TRINITY_DN7416_c0_g1_i2:846-1742(+)